MTTPMTVDEARRRAAAHAEAAAALLAPAVVESQEVPDSACVDVVPPGAISVAARVWVRGVDVGAALTRLYEQWTGDGYEILDDRRAGPARTLLVGHPGDGFWLRASVNVRDELMITVSSPCLWPGGSTPSAD
jgi:hypothetical protein